MIRFVVGPMDQTLRRDFATLLPTLSVIVLILSMLPVYDWVTTVQDGFSDAMFDLKKRLEMLIGQNFDQQFAAHRVRKILPTSCAKLRQDFVGDAPAVVIKSLTLLGKDSMCFMLHG